MIHTGLLISTQNIQAANAVKIMILSLYRYRPITSRYQPITVPGSSSFTVHHRLSPLKTDKNG
jgi:hypothetical protein